jgi:hypothetical protein
MEISSLPLDIIAKIREYFVAFPIFLTSNKVKYYGTARRLSDWRYFCNCSNSTFFQQVKHYLSFYKLSKRLSNSYLMYCNDEKNKMSFEFKEIIVKIMNIIENPKNQLFLDLFPDGNRALNLAVYKHILDNVFGIEIMLKSITPLPSVRVLFIFPIEENKDIDFTKCSIGNSTKSIQFISSCQVLDYKFLEDLRLEELLLDGVSSIRNVSCFKNIRMLSLPRCTKLIDVSPLRNAYYLNLEHCRKITGFSVLGKVYRLNLSFTKVTDVSALSGVYHLILDYCKHITDISSLNHVPILSIVGVTTNGLMSHNTIKELSFTGSRAAMNCVKDFEKKSKKVLKVYRDFGDTSSVNWDEWYSCLEGYTIIYLDFPSTVLTVTSLERLYFLPYNYVGLRHERNIQRILPNLLELTISASLYDIDFNFLPSLTKLTFDGIDISNATLTLKDSLTLKELRLFHPTNLIDLTLLHINLTVLQVTSCTDQNSSGCLMILLDEESSLDIIAIDCPYIIASTINVIELHVAGEEEEIEENYDEEGSNSDQEGNINDPEENNGDQ